MKLSELKTILPTLDNVTFQMENGTYVPEHFHITELGFVTKNFIDCGGTIREEKTVNLQLWNANDFDHRLNPTRLLDIIKLSEEKLKIIDAEIEVEYQTEITNSQTPNKPMINSLQTVGKFGLSFNGNNFELTNKQTACLASDKCGTSQKEKVKLSELKTANTSCCSPNSGCC